MRFNGIQKSLDEFAEALSHPEPTEAQAVQERITDLSRHIEQQIAEGGLTAGDITEPARQARGWLALLAQPPNFDRYLDAVGRAWPIFHRALGMDEQTPRELRVEFRPIKPPAKIGTGGARVTKVEMQTPMIAFDNDQFQTLAAGLVEQRPNREQLHAAMTHEPYQAVLAELEALGGVVEQPAGAAHDLTAAFDRVNNHYFQARLSRPRLIWSDTFTGRKFGHYDPVHDTVMVSVTLDHAEVPALAVDFVIYHELLHRELGIEWHNGRARPHDQRFQESEQQFGQFQQDKQVLERVAKRH